MLFIQNRTLLRVEDVLLAITLGKQTYTRIIKANKDKLSSYIKSVLPFCYILFLSLFLNSHLNGLFSSLLWQFMEFYAIS